MLNKIWTAIISISIIYAFFAHTLDNVANGFLKGCESTVSLCITFVGVTSFWLGIMQIIKDSNLLDKLRKFISPLINILFSNIKNNKKALDAISLNVTANFLGLGNAATPFGIEAIKYMNEQNQDKNKATHDMIMFLVLNTTCLQLIPTSIIAYRLATGSKNAGVVFIPILIATFFSTLFGIIITKIFIKRDKRC